MKISEKIKNKSFKGLRIAGTVSTIVAYGGMIAYFIYSGVSVLQNGGMWSAMFFLLAVVSAFGVATEMNLLWGELKRKDGTIEEMRKGTLVATIVLNVFIAVLAVLFWIAELNV